MLVDGKMLSYIARDVRPVALSDILNPWHGPVGLSDQGQVADVVVVFVLVRFGEESWLELEDALQIENVPPQYLGEIDITPLRSVDLRKWVDASDMVLDGCEATRIDKIDLVDENDVDEGDLLLRFRRPVDLFDEMFGIRDGDDGVEFRPAADVVIDKERLRHRRRICEAVVSMIMPSNARLRRINPAMIRMRSLRTVQQMQPLFNSKISSSESTMRSLSMPTSPNSFTITANRLPWVSERMRLSSVVFPEPR